MVWPSTTAAAGSEKGSETPGAVQALKAAAMTRRRPPRRKASLITPRCARGCADWWRPRLSHAEAHAPALGMEIEGGVKINRHRTAPTNAGEGFADEDLPARGDDRQHQPQHGAHRRGPWPRANDRLRGFDLPRGRAHARHRASRRQEGLDRRVFDNRRALAPGGVRESVGHLVRPGKPVTRTEGGAAEIVGLESRHHGARLCRFELDDVVEATGAL